MKTVTWEELHELDSLEGVEITEDQKLYISLVKVIEEKELLMLVIGAEVGYDTESTLELLEAVKQPSHLAEYLYNKFKNDKKKFATFSTAIILASQKKSPADVLSDLMEVARG